MKYLPNTLCLTKMERKNSIFTHKTKLNNTVKFNYKHPRIAIVITVDLDNSIF